MLLPALAMMAALGITPARAQAPSVDALITRVFGSEDKEPYELTADFTGSLSLAVRGTRLTVLAEGTYLETRGSDGIRRRKVNIRKLDLPFLLRPFSASIQRLIEEKIETHSETPEDYYAHDIFILSELPGRRYVLVGVHRSIVDEVLDRFGQPGDKKDVAVRRKIAEWLYTSPAMRDFLVRPGPPYAFQSVVDEAGLIYEVGVFYNWGEVTTRIAYATVGGQAVWRQVTADTMSEISGLGRVDGQLILNFANHCVNCRRS